MCPTRPRISSPTMFPGRARSSITSNTAGRRPDWRGRPWQEAAFLELHVGTFTPGGSFRAAIEKLDHVRDTGLTAIELMPVADFAGRRNWGYDGVLLYAPDSAYGRPDDLKALIDAAHLRGLMVFLDVVYNHFGPEGNYLVALRAGTSSPTRTRRGAPRSTTACRRCAPSRSRMRCIGCGTIASTGCGSMPCMPSWSRASLRCCTSSAGRSATSPRPAAGTIHLVLENDDNRASLARSATDPPHGKYRAQWNDDYHHAWHVLLTGEHQGYYQDYAPDPRRHIARVLSSGFAYQGEASPHRRDARAASRPARCRRWRSSISCRTTTRSAIARSAIASRRRPTTRRWRRRSPSRCSRRCRRSCSWARNGDRNGRFRSSAISRASSRTRCARGGARSSNRNMRELGDEIPDPLAEATFRSAVLDWDARETAAGRARLALVRESVDDPPRGDRAAARRRSLRHGALAGQRADRAIGGSATGRTCNSPPTFRTRTAPCAAGPARRPRRSGAMPPKRAALVGVLDARSALMPPAIPIATYRLQLTPSFGFDDAARDRALSQGARHQPSLCLAVPQGARRQHPWLRHHRPQRAQSGIRRRGRLPAAERCAGAGRHGADPRFRAEPHGRALRRQCLVARRAGMGTESALRELLRHRLEYAAGAGRTAAS